MESEPTVQQNTILQSVRDFIQEGGFGVAGETLFVFRAPDRKEKDANLWLIMPIGGRKKHTNVTGEDVKTYNFAIRYCSKDTFDLNRQLFNLDKYITSSKCYNLKDFATIGIEVLTCNDTPYIDDEQRWVGEITIQTTVYNILQEFPQKEDSEANSEGVDTGDKDEPSEGSNTSTGDIG